MSSPRTQPLSIIQQAAMPLSRASYPSKPREAAAHDSVVFAADDVLAARWADRHVVGGVEFVVTTPASSAAVVVEAATRPGRKKGEQIHLANAYTVALTTKRSHRMASLFAGNGWNLPDGKPIGIVSKLRGDSPSLNQVRGPQFFLDVFDVGRAAGLRHYLLGGAPEVLALLQTQLETMFPGVQIVGAHSPEFRDPTLAELHDRDTAIRESGAQVVWVGLGTPKQDIEAGRLADGLPVIAIAVGAGFDYAAGTLRHAPAWVSAIGMEWLFRFAMEPRRLWKRYVFGNLQFIGAVLRKPRDRHAGG